jgi:hypothetical protein
MSLIRMNFVGSRTAAGGCRREDDQSYHSRRAEEELALAQSAADCNVRRFRYHLAGLHLDRAHAAPQVRRVA